MRVSVDRIGPKRPVRLDTYAHYVGISVEISQIIQPGFSASNAATILSRASEASRSAVIQNLCAVRELRLLGRPTVCLCIGRAPGNHSDLPR